MSYIRLKGRTAYFLTDLYKVPQILEYKISAREIKKEPRKPNSWTVETWQRRILYERGESFKQK